MGSNKKILLKIEELPGENQGSQGLDSTQLSDEVISPAVATHHMELMFDAGLIRGQSTTFLSGEPNWCNAVRMTWEGHEFLDTIRPETTWEKIKQRAKEDGLGLTFDVIFALAKSFLPKPI